MSSHKHTSHASRAHHHVNLRLERWHRRCIYASCLAVALSGAAWLIAHHFLRRAGPFGDTIHPLEPWAIKLHGAGAMAMLFFVGSLMNSHIRRALKAGRNLASGWSMLLTTTALAFTGFGLSYLAGDSDRQAWSLVHWVVGLGFAVLVIVHVLVGRASRFQRPAG